MPGDVNSSSDARVSIDRNTGVNINVGGNTSSSGGGFNGPVRIDRSGVEDSGGESYDGGSYGGDYGYGDGGGSGSSQAYLEAQAAQAAARQAALERAERQRNENLRRQNDAKIAKSARDAQQSRKQPTAKTPAAMKTSSAANAANAFNAIKQQAGKDKQQANLAVPTVSANDVASATSEGVTEERRTRKSSASNAVDAFNALKERSNKSQPSYSGERQEEKAKPKKQPKPRKSSEKALARKTDAMTEAINKSLEGKAEPQGGSSQRNRVTQLRLSPMERLDARDEYEKELLARNGNLTRDDIIDAREAYERELQDRYRMPSDYERPSLLSDDMADAQEAYARELSSQEGTNVGVVTTPSPSIQDTPWEQGSDVTGLSGDKAMIRRILSDESDRQSLNYDTIKETETEGEGNFDDQREGKFPKPEDVLDRESDESFVQRKFREARNAIYKRWVNPSLLRIESERVEKHTEVVKGKKRTYARLRYSDRVEKAIGSVRNLYNCSTYNVMQLVQLRGGIGVDSHGKIANVDPNEFRLTDDQFVELCRDIVESQMRNGNPLGPVRGVPGGSGVRDDTGRYVVVAKTRCFPLGYMPRQLMRDLRRDWNSPLHSMSESQIAKAIGEQWINETYPELCANTGGNLMYQARAIENMMRGLMMIDGIDPSELMIPEVVERKTLMALRNEEATISDPDIRVANEIKAQRIQDALSRFKHRYRKEKYATRHSDGGMQSAASKRKRNRAGDAIGVLSMLERGAKAARIGVMISSIPEGAIANGEQKLAVTLSNAVFNHMHKDIADRYRMTADLDDISRSREAIEARGVAESLYRIGGHDALDAFFSELGDDGHARNRLTRKDLRDFLERMGVTGPGGTVSDRARELFHIKPGDEPGFLSNVGHVIDGIERIALGGNLSKASESRQFVQMSMAEMARSAVAKVARESYTNEQVADWGRIGGGEAMIRSLLQTDAGREAFMTQGITSLGRKSPVEHQMRCIMAKNRLTEFTVRTMFDRFPEYGVNKVLQMVPFSNTLSYFTAHAINGVGDILAATSDSMPGGGVPNFANAMQRNLGYQAGTRTSFAEGLRKNLLYDTIMAGEKLLIGALYCGIIMLLGGLKPPDDEKDRFTWSEWKIGKDENAVPIKWAWWMDDLSGVGLPLGMAWAMVMQGESTQDAANVFINAVANFNSGTALFDAIDLVNNFDEEWGRINTYGYNPSPDEWLMSTLEQGFWGTIGDLTPSFIGELVPWSKDYLFAGGRDAHTAGKVYDVGEGSKYSMEEAQRDYRTKRTGSYSDYVRRRSSQTNILQAMFNDWVNGVGRSDSAITGYKYTEQPLDTMVDPYVQAMYDRFYLDLDPRTTNIDPNMSEKDRMDELYSRAEVVCQWIDEHYQNSTQANLDGFVLNYDARVNCINYCYHMIDEAWAKYRDDTSNGWLDDDEYESVVQDRQDTINHYKNLINNYFKSDDIPWSMPRYVRQESDRETRYVDDNGNPMTFVDQFGDDWQSRIDTVLNPILNTVGLGNRSTTGEQAHAESYWYGNQPGLLPASSPVREDKGYNFETIPYWTVLDENGNPVNDVAAAYDNAGTLPAIKEGRNEGKDVRELMWGGQGNNLKDDTEERLNIPREGVPTIGDRPWRKMEETFPESLKNLDSDTVTKLLGIPSSIPDDNESSSGSSGGEGSSGGSGGGSRSYYSRSGGGGGYYYRGGGSYSSSGGVNYNPRIYSTPRQVYSDRAQGLSVKTPYKATTTYLRPNFYTKGSREAYKRSDI